MWRRSPRSPLVLVAPFILARPSSVWRSSSSLAPRPPCGADEPRSPRAASHMYIVASARYLQQCSTVRFKTRRASHDYIYEDRFDVA